MKIEEISGVGEYTSEIEKLKEGERKLYRVEGKVFLVENKNTIEVRTDEKLGKLLAEKYESVMQSRYFGRGGIEIVPTGQLEEREIEDLVRLSYNMSKEK